MSRCQHLSGRVQHSAYALGAPKIFSFLAPTSLSYEKNSLSAVTLNRKISTINKQDLEICSKTKILNIYIEDVEKMLQHTSMSYDGLQVVRVGIEELKKDHQNVKDRFTEFTQELGTSNESFQESRASLVSLQKEEQDVKARLTNLMIEGWCVIDMNGSEMVIEVSKKKEEHENERFKKEESKVGMMMSSEEEMEVMSDLFDIDTNTEGLKEDMLSTLLDIKNGVIKNDHFGKSPLIDCLKAACGESDEEEEAVDAIEDREVKLGI